MPGIRVGFVGAGYVAGRHAESLARLDEALITAVADPDPNRREGFASRTGARPYPAHDAMLDAEALDALYICVPPDAHGSPEYMAIDRGLPFFVEKPLSCVPGMAEQIGSAVQAGGLVTATGYHWRYLDTVEQAAELLTARPPKLVLGYWLDRAPGTGWWAYQKRSGGQLVEQATHLFDLARLLGGELGVVHAEATGCDMAADGDIDRATVCLLRFSSGAIGMVSATSLLRRGYRIGMEFCCDGLVLELSERQLIIHDGADGRRVAARGDPFAREDADFIGAVRGDADRIRVPYAEALRTHQLAMTAAAACSRGEPR